MAYLIVERVQNITLYLENGNCARLTARLLNNTHPNVNLSHTYFAKLVE